jgi:hypothetical protein
MFVASRWGAPGVWWGVVVLVAGGVPVAGCGGGPPPARSTTPAAAFQVLTTVLEAWKAGTDPRAVAEGAAPIYVSDEDWGRGWKLADYTVPEEGEPFGASMRFHVDLHLESATGAVARKTARFVVSTDPVANVARDDSGE